MTANSPVSTSLAAVLAELKAVPMLAQISAASLQWLGSQVKLREVSAGQALFMQDAWGSVVYLMLSGWAKVRRAVRVRDGESVQDNSKTLAILGPGSWVGEMAVLDEAPRSRDVLALTTVRVAGIPAAIFSELMIQEPQLCYQLAISLSRRLRLTNLQADLSQQSPPVRLVHTLVQLGEAFGEKTPQGVRIFHPPLQDLADISQVSLEAATAVLDRFIRQGVVKLLPDQQSLLLVQYAKLVEATRLL
ncbi:Crp/Fnr family transcriptional regulator [Thermostichus vulcanus]|uniref:Crp/Fnr family transcriptional regulator n=1 Tax=Thermostichus vulcanus str. 'Rupite' TaxID=2813851 RepID=A0ABT0CAS0_THEVL|nr:Crp/Fnr family transcriptional regulator [Thermostichus vulcanus]MCJ2542884.1 Crp/Fnr family transcriptional regulator [Thermostichus vulcanus str. 'Rupite']